MMPLLEALHLAPLLARAALLVPPVEQLHVVALALAREGAVLHRYRRLFGERELLAEEASDLWTGVFLGRGGDAHTPLRYLVLVRCRPAGARLGRRPAAVDPQARHADDDKNDDQSYPSAHAPSIAAARFPREAGAPRAQCALTRENASTEAAFRSGTLAAFGLTAWHMMCASVRRNEPHARQSEPRLQGGRGSVPQGAGAARAPGSAARNAAHDPQAQGDRTSPSRHQGTHQGAGRRDRRGPPRRRARRPLAGDSSRGCGADRAGRTAECRQIPAPRAIDSLGCARRPVSVHHSVSSPRDDALRGHPLSARGSAGRRIGTSAALAGGDAAERGDRKSTRLNSSHVEISYAVFCLKKKKYNFVNSVYHDCVPQQSVYMFPPAHPANAVHYHCTSAASNSPQSRAAEPAFPRAACWHQ